MKHHISAIRPPLRIAAALLGSAFTLGISLPVQGAISPFDRDRLEGSSNTVYPLGRARTRVQQLIGDLPTTAMTLQGHAYRRDATNVRGVVAAFRSQVTVNVSLSSRTPSTASTTFADNQGTPQLVLPQTWISFPQTDRPAVEPASQFELRIPWITPFAWPGAGTLCLETIVTSNDVGGLPDRNFTVYQDGHDLSRTTSRQPGYRFGQGCAPEGSTTRTTATLDLVRTTTSLDLEASVRAGMATTGGTSGFAALLLGTTSASWTWPSRPDCMVQVVPLYASVIGSTDASGNLDVTLRGVGFAPVGRTVLAQVLTLQPLTGLGTLSDANRLTIPAPPVSQVLHARIANGDDANALTGTVSFSVPVVSLF